MCDFGMRWTESKLEMNRAKVLAIEKNIVSIGPIEAIDGTPVVDIKCVVKPLADD